MSEILAALAIRERAQRTLMADALADDANHLGSVLQFLSVWSREIIEVEIADLRIRAHRLRSGQKERN